MAITREEFDSVIEEKGLLEGEAEYFLHGSDIRFVYDQENARGAKRQRVIAMGIIPISVVSDYTDYLVESRLPNEVRAVSDVVSRAVIKQCGVKCSQVGFSGIFPLEDDPMAEQTMNYIARLPINDPQALSMFIDTVNTSIIEKRIVGKLPGSK